MTITYYSLHQDITVNTNFSREHVKYYIKSYLFKKKAYSELNEYREHNEAVSIQYYIMIRKLTIF